MLSAFAYLAIGALSGVLAGLMGIGGGLVVVPCLLYVLRAQGIGADVVMHMAIATSLATVAATAAASTIVHHRRGTVQWPLFRGLAPGVVIGAAAGAGLADLLDTQSLRAIFGAFELLVAAYMLSGLTPTPSAKSPRPPLLFAAALLIGAVSAVAGIGGGIMIVPFLVWCRVGLREAVSTSAACGVPIALAGSLGFMIAGTSGEALPPWSIGYVYLPALFGIGVASVWTARYGAQLAHTLPVQTLRRVFAVVLAAVGVMLLVGA